jgi:uncharacterized membrane protein
MNDTGEPSHETADAPIMVRLVERLESTAALDRFSPVLSPLADILLASAARRDVLLGTSVGHAVHPFLTDLPIGAWTCTTLLDLVGGEWSARAAKQLLGFGLITAVPTAVTGLAEWGTTRGANQRVGVAHAGANTAALACYAASWVARSRGRHHKGVVLALGGATAAAVGGFLGGHLAIARHVGSRHPTFDDGSVASAG